MALKFIESNEPIPVTKVDMLLYGSQSSGKTTLGLSGKGYKDWISQETKRTLLIDLECGTGGKNIERDRSGATVLRLDKWSDVMSLTREMLEPFGIIVIDTVMAMQQMMMGELDPKSYTKTGGLTKGGYGELASMAKNFFTRMSSFNLNFNLVLLAHEKKENENDVVTIIPDITGGLKQQILRQVDYIGHTKIVGDKEKAQYTLTFDAYENTICKSRAGLKEDIILSKNPDNLALILTEALTQMNALSEEQVAQQKVFDEIRNQILDSTSAMEFTMIMDAHKTTFAKDRTLYQFWLQSAKEYCTLETDANGRKTLVDKEIEPEDDDIPESSEQTQATVEATNVEATA